jgi:hypothetical protein
MLRSLAEYSGTKIFASEDSDSDSISDDGEGSPLLIGEDPLYQRILPPQQLDIPYIPPEKRPVRDPLMAIFYCAALLLMLILASVRYLNSKL